MNTAPAESILAQWFRRIWNEGDASAIDELCTPDVVSHGLNGDLCGPRVWREQFYEPMRSAFSKVFVTILSEIQQGEFIMARLEATMVLRSTGQEVTMPGFSHTRVVNGRFAEAWDVWDFLGVLEKMELLPPASFGMAVTGHLAAHQALAK